MDVNGEGIIRLKTAYINMLANLPASVSLFTDHRGIQPNSCGEDYPKLCTGV
jgi:hypothetical protein